MDLPVVDSQLPMAVYRQIYDWARQSIADGHLQSGDRLPAERALARELHVSRSTVVRAYDELAAEGLVSRRVGVGTAVTAGAGEELPDAEDALFWASLFTDKVVRPRRIVNTLHFGPVPGELSLSEVSAPASDFPTERFAEICAEAISSVGGKIAGYTETGGLPGLRDVLRERTVGLDTAAIPRDVMVTSGAVEALNLVVRLFVEKGDVVVVEDPTFPCAVTSLSATGAQVIGIPMGREGMRLEILDQVVRRQEVKLLITVPNFQNPTGTVMPDAAKRELLDLTRMYGVTVFADDVFGELQYEGPRPRSLLSFERSEHVLEASSLSKVLGGGLRIGWLTGPEPVLARVADLKQSFNTNTNVVMQHIAERMFRSGLVEEQLERTRGLHRQRLDELTEALSEACGDDVSFDRPDGGLSLWCELRTGHSADELLSEVQEEGVSFIPGSALTVDGAEDARFRLAIGAVEGERTREFGWRLAAAIARLREREPRPRARGNGNRPLI